MTGGSPVEAHGLASPKRPGSAEAGDDNGSLTGAAATGTDRLQNNTRSCAGNFAATMLTSVSRVMAHG